ncbi:MAG TPA: VOC family protein [Kribbella sp.]|nr:VOC family protein [Kribbella sp.]
MTSVWYDAPSHAAGAALADGVADLDIRSTGVRVLADDLTEVSARARELGLTENPEGLQTLDVEFQAADPAAVGTFWDIALGGLENPLRRGPAFAVRKLEDHRPLRNRIHVDVVRPEDAVLRARQAIGQEPTGPYGVMLADPEGNEVDLVPGEPLPGTTDWYAIFSAMAFYPNAPAGFVTTVAELADSAGIPLLIDVRREGVTVDSGKDRWEGGTHGADPGFVALAQQIEGVAKDLGLQADPAPLRFVQFGIDALDVPAVRAFWVKFLGYEEDARPNVTDVYDPSWLNPVLIFQQLDEPRPQRNRIRFDLAVPEEMIEQRVGAALAVGGRVLSENPYLVADPEGNEILLGTRRTCPST